MKNIRFWFHVGLLVSFALPWLKVPFIFTAVYVTGYRLPYQTTHLAQELNSLGVMTISSEKMIPMYLMLLAPALSFLVIFSFVMNRPLHAYFDSVIGFIAVMSCLYVLTNTGNVVAYGLYVALVASLVLVTAPLVVSDTGLAFGRTKKVRSFPDKSF